MVTHRESRGNSQRKHTLNKNLITCDIVIKCMSLNSLYQKVTYRGLNLRRRNADPNKVLLLDNILLMLTKCIICLKRLALTYLEKKKKKNRNRRHDRQYLSVIDNWSKFQYLKSFGILILQLPLYHCGILKVKIFVILNIILSSFTPVLLEYIFPNFCSLLRPSPLFLLVLAASLAEICWIMPGPITISCCYGSWQ